MEETYTETFPCTLINGPASTVDVTWQDCGDSSPYTVTLNEARLPDAIEGEDYRIDRDVWFEILDWLHDLDEEKQDEEEKLNLNEA